MLVIRKLAEMLHFSKLKVMNYSLTNLFRMDSSHLLV